MSSSPAMPPNVPQHFSFFNIGVVVKKWILILLVVFTTHSFADEDLFESKQIWTSLLVNTIKIGDVQHKVYTESWNDTEEGIYLWLISNKFAYNINKTWGVAFNYTFLDIQGGNKVVSETPHQHRFEFESTNKLKAWADWSIRNRIENRFKPQVEESDLKWDFRYRLQITATLPAIESLPWLKIYFADEFILDTPKFGDYFSDFRETYNENRWTIVGFSVKANEHISFKLYPAMRFKASSTNNWSETGILGFLLINTF